MLSNPPEFSRVAQARFEAHLETIYINSTLNLDVQSQHVRRKGIQPTINASAMDSKYPAQRRPMYNQYLIVYNLTCAVLWLAILGRVVLLIPLVGYQNIYGGVGELAKWTQTLAVLEVAHSGLGL
ncbi:hypothetical protein MMC24_003951 [Lignoscripta atroalba]|nr:hypothetical protein [Lignoscripta atroalba]